MSGLRGRAGRWAGGFAAELRDDAEALSAVRRRVQKSPLGSAAGYGSPNLPIDREATRKRLEFATTHEPVTAVQLSRDDHAGFRVDLDFRDMTAVRERGGHRTGGVVDVQR